MNKPFFSVKRNVIFTAIFYTFLWGSAFPVVKICMESLGISDSDNMSKCLVAGIRFVLSGLITLLWCKVFYKEKSLLNKQQIKYILLYGILATAFQYAFTYISLSRIDGSKGAIYDQLCVFVIVLMSGLVFKDDKLSIKKILGCITGFLGVVIINTNGLGFDFSLGGEGVMLLAVVCQTVAYFVAKGSSDKIPAPYLVGCGQLIGGVILCVFSLCLGGKICIINSTAIITLIILALISAVAYVLSLMPLKYFPASEISSFNLLITVFGVVMSSLLLKEDIFRWNYAVSLALIAIGIVFINSRGKDKWKGIFLM